MDKNTEREALKVYTDWSHNNPNAPKLTRQEVLEQIEEYFANREPIQFIEEKIVITEIEQLKIDLEFSEFEKRLLEDELIDLKLSAEPKQVIDMNVYQSLFSELEGLKASLNPVTNFFTTPDNSVSEPNKRISKKQREQQELDEHLKKLELIALNKYNKGLNSPKPKN